MWSRFIVICLIFMCLCFKIAQAQAWKNFKLGIKPGVNFANFIEKGTKNSFLFSYNCGLSLEQSVSSKFSISLDILYSKQGNITKFSNPGRFEKVRTRYDYILFPVALKYRPKSLPIIVGPGFQFARLLNQQIDFLPKNGYTNDNPMLKTSDYGLFISLGYNFSTYLSVEAKYYKSLKTVFNNSYIDSSTGALIYTPSISRFNQVISASLIFYVIR